MMQVFIVFVALAALALMSWRAGRRFHHQARLPMQWLPDGTVTWMASRRVALAFTPVFATGVLLFTAALSLFATPRAGQEGLEIPVLLGVALMFTGIHALHLFLIGKSLRAGK